MSLKFKKKKDKMKYAKQAPLHISSNLLVHMHAFNVRLCVYISKKTVHHAMVKRKDIRMWQAGLSVHLGHAILIHKLRRAAV